MHLLHPLCVVSTSTRPQPYTTTAPWATVRTPERVIAPQHTRSRSVVCVARTDSPHSAAMVGTEAQHPSAPMWSATISATSFWVGDSPRLARIAVTWA